MGRGVSADRYDEFLSEVASCPECGCLVLAASLPGPGGRVEVVWDPSWADRRLIRSHLTAGDVRRQGFGLGVSTSHECPPPWECSLTAEERGRGGVGR